MLAVENGHVHILHYAIENDCPLRETTL
jgi:hypothetical protein